MKKAAAFLPKDIAKAKIKELGKPLNAAPPKTTLLNDAKGREQLSNMLMTAYDGLKVYGKEPEQLEGLTKLFQLVLADYTSEQITLAFRMYIKHHTEMPAPADIAQIIERGNRPAFNQAVYVSISKKHPEDRSPEEWSYMKEYQKFSISGRH